MTIESIISTYGYLAILIGVFVEGELVVMTAGFLAHRQILELHWVIGAALFGSLCTYQIFFLLGRTQGMRFVARRPRLKARLGRIQGLLEQHHTWVTLGYRALFGFRAMTPFALGMTDVSHRRFFALDLLPAVVWAITFSYLGYALGQGFEAVLADIHKYQLWMAVAVAGAATAVLAAVLVVRRFVRI
ncbi:MAG: DedA family protein [Gammaproteobacteria bacterium]